MTKFLKHIRLAAANRNTYRIGLLQAKAYRILQKTTSQVLKPFKISSIEWAFMGLLFDTKGIRPTHAAKELGVEAPFVTAMVTHLSTLGFLVQERDAEDSRKKMITLTSKGKSFIESTEQKVRSQMRYLVAGASPGDLMGYLSILELIAKNGEEI